MEAAELRGLLRPAGRGQLLVTEAGPDVVSKDKWGETALDLVRRRIHEGWVFVDREGLRAVVAVLESRITNYGPRIQG